MISYNFLFVSLFVNFIFIIFFKRISKFIDIKDLPDRKRKFQKKAVYLLGGTFLIANLLIILIYSVLSSHALLDHNFFSTNREYFAFIFGLICFYIFGLYDDKYNLPANTKLLFSIILISFIILIDNDLIIEELKFSFLNNNIELKSFSFFFTILCVMLFTNALNMFDGINLQSVSYSILIFSIFIYKSIFVNLSLVMITSLLFVLYLNYKNKIYLGESGIQFLAFIICYIFLKTENMNLDIFHADEIFLIMALPGLDMFRLFLLRIFSGKHPFKPDRQHLHHYICSFFTDLQTFFIIFSYIFISIILYKFSENKIIYLSLYIVVYFILMSYLIKKIKNN
jgi:UDP-GlcNAc:undecaprenyl-phosphate/decaprenyl-phosphate GlcNAc-1-phosphate transferase